MTANVAVGQPLPRVDALEKVTGRAIYGDDLRFSGLLYGKALRSPHSHAKIGDVNVTKAGRVPGVKAIVTGQDIPVLGGESLKDYPFLAVDKVRYVGEPVVALAAVDEETAEEALDLIMESIQDAGYTPGKDIFLALDVAASEFFTDNSYVFKKSDGSKKSTQDMIAFYADLIEKYPIVSIEDGFDEDEARLHLAFTAFQAVDVAVAYLHDEGVEVALVFEDASGGLEVVA